MSDIAFKIRDAIAEDIYKKGRADGYSKAENDYHEKHQDILIKQYEGGCEQGRAEERERIVAELKQAIENGVIKIEKGSEKLFEIVRGGENE